MRNINAAVALALLHFCMFLLCSCSRGNRQEVDRLNDLSYAHHYRSLDATQSYADQAYNLADGYADGRAEALNNLAFVMISRMQYDEARDLLLQAQRITDNQIELLVSEIQLMRLCQRMSKNREFYDHREQAQRALLRIDEERASLDDRQQKRLDYAQSEMSIVTSTYYYYVGLERQSVAALESGVHNERDTAQYLNYLYNVGSGGIISQGTQADINQQEFDYLLRCYLLAEQSGCYYFAANSLEALAEHLIDTLSARQLIADNLPAMKYLNPAQVSDEQLSVDMAQRSLDIFSDFGDVYQIAGANRTLASCYLAQGHYEWALEHLHLALADTAINQAPDLVASINEQLSVAYAAVDDKAKSDYHRNIYLDMQEQTRQDRWLEARADQLKETVAQLNLLLAAVVMAIVFLVALLWYFYWRWKHKPQSQDSELMEREEDLREQLHIVRQHVESSERRNLEQRAKVSLVNSITPFIDRIIHEAKRLSSPVSGNASTPERRELDEQRIQYIRELTSKINEQNDVLTHWIQLRQGELNLHIETFSLQQLFDIVAKSERSFRLKQVTLRIDPTTARVKADRVLTLFMLNTLADNARKFTPEGGSVHIYAENTEQYVEISVSDSGIGMDEDQLAHVFEHHISGGHGFGLLNCKGIIEKYRKLSRIFSVCQLSAESRVGQGSRFFFRLPVGKTVVGSFMLALLMAFSCQPLMAQPASSAQFMPVAGSALPLLERAYIYADSAYFSNINGTYERTLLFADSCRHCLNSYYRMQRPAGTDTLVALGDPSATLPEIMWLHDSVDVNYNVVLDIRNESAVASLALHRWQLYHYNNRIYTLLMKELTADAGLDGYCRMMQKSEADKRIAIFLFVMFFLAILLALTWQLLASLTKSARQKQDHLARLEMMEDELQRITLEEDNLHVSNSVLDNCLSTLKHETMYYPDRIRQLADSADTDALTEVVSYYRELYGILSEQAMHQVERSKLKLKPLDHEILGDKVLIDFLFDILQKQGQRQVTVDYAPRDDKYVMCTVAMPMLKLTEQQAASLFTPQIENIPYLLCRQIVRDHGEVANRRGCAIWAELRGGVATIIITLPRIWTNSKLSS